MTEQQQQERGITVLVTGATGTVGNEVVKQLVASSLPSSHSDRHVIIKAAIHSQGKADTFKQYDNKTVQIVNMDYNKPETITDVLNRVDKLFLLTLPTQNSIDIYSNLVREIRKSGNISHIVKLSSMAVEIGLDNAIGRLHREEEKIIEESGIPFTFLRPSAFMQNFVNYFSQTIRTHNAFYLPAGDGKVSFVDARDIAAVSVQALTTGSQQHIGKAYTITGQEAISHGQAAEILSKEVGKRISYVDVPEEDALKGMREPGMEDWLITATMESYRIIRAGYASQTTKVVEQITGRKPITFSQFAKDYAGAFK
jgi:uncharacterized protein YbjT (DUF2867 family)